MDGQTLEPAQPPTGGAPAIEEDDSDSTSLDLTSYQLHDLESVELPQGLIELDLTANRLSKLDPRIAQLNCLKKLSLRQNLFDDPGVEPLSSWDAISGLEELVLRDNKLMKIPDVSIFKSLVVFDVSFNEISSLNGLSKVASTLKELYVSKNEVTKMEEIEHFHQLQILELGSNRLRVIENLHSLTNLQELWLGRNRIRVVDLCGLKHIKKISLQSNRLTSMKGFEECVALEELYLSHNGISKMEGLSTLVNLRVLDVSSNKLTSVDDIGNLANLEDLWLNDNQITSLDGLAEAVAGSREKLTTIYLENNPCVCPTNPFPTYFLHTALVHYVLACSISYLPCLKLSCLPVLLLLFPKPINYFKRVAILGNFFNQETTALRGFINGMKMLNYNMQSNSLYSFIPVYVKDLSGSERAGFDAYLAS